MAIFNSNKVNQAGMPPEVNDFYKAEGRERTVVAWIMAIGTLLLTIAIVLGLFYGGRWVIRKVKNNKEAPVAVQTETSSTNTTNTETGTSQSSSASGSSQTSQASGSSSSASNSSSSAPSSSSANAPGTASTSTPSASSTSQGANASLTNTGPGDTFAIFMAVSVLAYFVHRFYLTESK